MNENDVLTARPSADPGSGGDGVPVSLRATYRLLNEREEHYRDEVRRLIAAAIEVMRGSPTADPRVSDIVRTAELSNAAFYRHFASKDELLVAVMDFGLRELVGHLERRMAAHDEPVARIRQWVRGLLDQARNPQVAGATRPFVLDRARLAAAFPDEVRRSTETLTAPLQAVLEQIAELLAPEVEPDVGARTTYRLCQAELEAHLTAGTTPTDQDLERTVRFTLRGLGLHPDT